MRLRSKSVKFTGEQRNHHCYKERTLSAVAEFSHISPGPVSRVILHKAYRGAGPTRCKPAAVSCSNGAAAIHLNSTLLNIETDNSPVVNIQRRQTPEIDIKET